LLEKACIGHYYERKIILVCFGYITEKDSLLRGSGGFRMAPPLTGSILKQVKILHESALFWHKTLKHFWEGA